MQAASRSHRRTPPNRDRSGGPSGSPPRPVPELQEEQMVGSIDPRCETLRGTHWPVKVAGVFGTRVAENHLGQRSTDRINRPDIWMQAIRSDLEKLLRHGGRPHMGPGFRRDDIGASLMTGTAWCIASR